MRRVPGCWAACRRGARRGWPDSALPPTVRPPSLVAGGAVFAAGKTGAAERTSRKDSIAQRLPSSNSCTSSARRSGTLRPSPSFATMSSSTACVPVPNVGGAVCVCARETDAESHDEDGDQERSLHGPSRSRLVRTVTASVLVWSWVSSRKIDCRSSFVVAPSTARLVPQRSTPLSRLAGECAMNARGVPWPSVTMCRSRPLGDSAPTAFRGVPRGPVSVGRRACFPR